MLRVLRTLFETLRNFEWLTSLWEWVKEKVKENKWEQAVWGALSAAVAKASEVPWEWWPIIIVFVIGLVGMWRERHPVNPPIVPTKTPPVKPSPVHLEPEITPHGGERFTLEIRYPSTASYYGYGWLTGPGVSRQEHFNLSWEGNHHRTEGEVVTICVARILSGALRVTDDDFRTVHEDREWDEPLSYYYPTEWLTLKVEIRVRGRTRGWPHKFKFRMKHRGEFEVHNVGGA